MRDPIDQHLASLKQGRYSTSTLRERERVLRSLPFDVTSVDRASTRAWWDSRQQLEGGTPRAASSLSQEASHLRSFYRWAMQEGLVERNAGDWLPRVRRSQKKPTPVQEPDLYRLMREAPDDMHRMIALAAMAGLRSAEVGHVRWEDIDRGNGVLWVRGGKGDKDRSVPLSSGLLAELGDPSEGHIVGRPMTGKAVSLAIARYMRRRGVDSTAHKLRARYLTRFLAATGDLAAAAEVAGHSDLTSIGRYVVASSDTMRRGAEAAGRIG